MDTPAPVSVTLPDGRELAYEIYGDRDGSPLVFHHGVPGSRVLGALLSDAARDRGVCVIAPTRPGYGASDPAPDRTLKTWADDCTALADHLALGSFAVAGFSGGGSFALHVAETLPDRITTVGLVGALVPGSDGGLFEALARVPLLLGVAFRGSRWMARYRPEFVTEQLTDRTVDDETASIVSRDFRVALEQGSTGVVRDCCLLAAEWSLPTPDVPTRAWHGSTDENVSIDPVRTAFTDLPTATFSEIEADHLGALLAVREEIVELAD